MTHKTSIFKVISVQHINYFSNRKKRTDFWLVNTAILLISRAYEAKGSTSVVKELVILKVIEWESRNTNLMWCVFSIKRKWKLRKYILCKSLNFVIVLVIFIKYILHIRKSCS